MHIQWSVVAGLLAGTATATSADFCGTGPSSFALRDVVQNHPEAHRAVRGAGCDISVDTFVHVIGASDRVEDGYITDETVHGQMDLLNESYEPHGFSFKLMEITRTINESWASPGGTPVKNSTEHELRAALRRGGYQDLNLFFVPGLTPNGKCELPLPDPTSQNITDDGCIMRPMTPGAARPEYGLVTVHEVGHWLGLEHTFMNGCEEPGDGVDDTPAEAEPVGGQNCPEPGRDTCPDKPGLDPVDNYMTYVAASCGPQRFTPGQVERMRILWKKLRAPFQSEDSR
ncbi:Extracellular metalloprotease-like protein [Hapsidospora chrysogenum ATCC 11550]|uniref:Extracellular metalloprotease-like protein n=1 Tax=Hapsidospora chrysogenum (strain ATCC 11550 / CBS 779.69 / DSM 880 / IAM 14645 / JCM 23072 / IMI 49137) TaxID=857340 RepID=A0A086TFW4_HAPC1|nr:Extracellular metalloprotease-like protein [Hapsidospora chrysogenum ATCC 11550]